MFLNFPKLCALLLFGTVIFNEYLCYFISWRAWPSVPQDACTVLFLGDPQLQGTVDEPPGLWGSIRRLDSDRYLKNVYSWLSSTYPFSTTVFLGDLIDEGSIAFDEEYEEYTQRFFNIFPQKSTKSSIFIPGDNDIGGEGADRVTLKKISRFEQAFGEGKPIYSPCSFLDIVPVSRLTEHGSFNITSKIEHIAKHKTVVVISHVPVLPLDGRFAERVMDNINPDVIFSAHDHRGFLYTGKRTSLKMDKTMDPFTQQDDITPIKLQTRQNNTDGSVEMSETMSEIVVPTISYRMGVKEMGAGLAVFSRSGELVYTNLWVPARFPLLYLYLATGITVAILLIVGKCIDLRKLTRRRVEFQDRRRKNYTPLLNF